MRRFFPDEASALRGSAEIALQVELNAPIAPQVAATNLNALAASYLAEQRFCVGYDTLRQARWALKKFTERFGTMQPNEVTSSMVQSWVAQLPLQTRGRFNAFSCVRAFYNSPALRSTYGNPCLAAPRKQDRNHRLQILTNKEARMLVQAEFPTWFRAWLIGGMFAGLRTCEMQRMDHSRFDWEECEIVVKKEDSKGGEACRPRTITMQPALQRQLHRGEGPYLEGKTNRQFEPYWKIVADMLGHKTYPRNILRHTFASNLLASSSDAVKTAFEMGHTSPLLLYSTYANCVTKKASREFWDL